MEGKYLLIKESDNSFQTKMHTPTTIQKSLVNAQNDQYGNATYTFRDVKAKIKEPVFLDSDVITRGIIGLSITQTKEGTSFIFKANLDRELQPYIGQRYKLIYTSTVDQLDPRNKLYDYGTFFISSLDSTMNDLSYSCSFRQLGDNLNETEVFFNCNRLKDGKRVGVASHIKALMEQTSIESVIFQDGLESKLEAINNITKTYIGQTAYSVLQDLKAYTDAERLFIRFQVRDRTLYVFLSQLDKYRQAGTNSQLSYSIQSYSIFGNPYEFNIPYDINYGYTTDNVFTTLLLYNNNSEQSYIGNHYVNDRLSQQFGKITKSYEMDENYKDVEDNVAKGFYLENTIPTTLTMTFDIDHPLFTIYDTFNADWFIRNFDIHDEFPDIYGERSLVFVVESVESTVNGFICSETITLKLYKVRFDELKEG